MSISGERQRRPNLVNQTTDRLRDRIFASEPGALIGSLQDIARSMGVGVVTVQQAARVLEHEGLLESRRGPGGGYFGTRPDNAAIERALAAYMRINPATWEEALDMTSLLFNELATAAAKCRDEGLRAKLAELAETVDVRSDVDDFGAFEAEFQELLFRMVRRPMFEMLTRVTLHYAESRSDQPVRPMDVGAAHWREGRRKIIKAILANDAELTRFEAERQNRRVVLGYLNSRSG